MAEQVAPGSRLVAGRDAMAIDKPSLFTRISRRVVHHGRQLVTGIGVVLAQVSRLIPAFIWLHITANRKTSVKMDYPAKDIRLSITTPSELRLRANSANKEPDTVAWVEALPHDAVLYDLGANVGAYSLIAAKRHPEIEVVAVEPSFTTFSQLCTNVLLNDLHERITPVLAALTSETGVGILHLQSVEAGAAMHSVDAPSIHGLPSAASLPVVTYRLDDLIETFGLTPPTHVKMDVDGGEIALISGASEALADSGLISIHAECNDPDGADSSWVRVVKDAGFRMTARSAHGNCLFERVS